ncbi:helix-turn-helix domain-containing protein [Aestuariivita boseongensis]|uniref:helix-turn-helix domain-containing protein n=1 Tax=Aestuariivita boseongensis TaxID=1470562 RepID=UPI000680A835|nr:helix-turn-helix transcriptional regulator [Aestuariivita boseongensis]
MIDSASLRSRLASRLFSLRSETGLSLDALARKSGISRATLSRIENAETSPTAETLQAICGALGLPVSRLIAMIEDGFDPLIPFEDQGEWEDPETGFTRRAVSPPSAQLRASVDEIHLPPDTRHNATQTDGGECHLILLDGAVTVATGGTTHSLTAGDCLRFRQDAPTQFQTSPDRGARFLQIRT